MIRERLGAELRALPSVRSVGEAPLLGTARKMLEETPPDIVVLDLNLPDGHGLDLLREIRKKGPAPVVVVFTNHAEPAYRRACTKAGADFFFDKSTEFSKVAEVIATIGA